MIGPKGFSPFDGYVSMIHVHSGVHLTAGQPIMQVINSEHMHIELKVYEKDALRLRLDQKVKFKVPEATNKIFTGYLYRIGKVILDDRTVLAHVHLDEESNDSFLPGMYVEAEIEVGDEPREFIDKSLIERSGFKYFAMELVEMSDENYVFERRSLPITGEEANFYVLSDSLGRWRGKLFLKGHIDPAPDN